MTLILPQARIYHILCPSFQGATLLSALLNNHSQVTSLGDSIPIRAMNSRCTCGKKVSECDFWQELYEQIGLSTFANEPLWLPTYPRLFDRQSNSSTSPVNRVLNQLMLGLTVPLGKIVWKLAAKPCQEYYETYINFVNFIAQKNQSTVFIDGSKRRFTSAFIQSYSNNQVPAKVIHLTRHPLNFVYSAMDKKNRSVEDAAKQWVAVHNKILRIKKLFLNQDSYFRLSYEDLCENPPHFLKSVLNFLELEYEDLQKPFVSPSKNHIVGSRSIHRFDGTIRKSTRNSKLSTSETQKIYQITKPLLEEFQYDI